MLGGGQLGRYALMAARVMGYQTMVLDPDPAAPAGRIADVHIVAAFDDDAAIDRMRRDCSVITTEFENPPAATLERLALHTEVRPGAAAVAIVQDRVAEKQFLVDNGLPVGPYDVIDRVDASISVKYPARLKTARLGYDGKGQRVVGDWGETRAAWTLMGGVTCVLEQALPLDVEVSVVCGRSSNGAFAAYPVAENVHVDGILDLTVVPARISGDMAARATGLALTIADALDYVGVLAVEFFVVGGELLVNEIAPRPHNSGHWTIDVAQTSQFAQQVRAACGASLGDTSLRAGGAAMVNLLGEVWNDGEPAWGKVLSDPRAALHLYGKAAPRTGRKMGHLTVWDEDPSTAATRALAARRALTE